MRSSEDIAHAIYLADWKEWRVSPDDPEQPKEWDELNEEEQTTYLRHVNAAFEHLFEHGRISTYISAENLEELSAEYKAYLETEEHKA